MGARTLTDRVGAERLGPLAWLVSFVERERKFHDFDNKWLRTRYTVRHARILGARRTSAETA